MHIHWHKAVEENRDHNGMLYNRYMQCRCGHRKITQRVINVPVDRSWIETGVFRTMPRSAPRRRGAGEN